jgi:hypothetical protein
MMNTIDMSPRHYDNNLYYMQLRFETAPDMWCTFGIGIGVILLIGILVWMLIRKR